MAASVLTDVQAAITRGIVEGLPAPLRIDGDDLSATITYADWDHTVAWFEAEAIVHYGEQEATTAYITYDVLVVTPHALGGWYATVVTPWPDLAGDL